MPSDETIPFKYPKNATLLRWHEIDQEDRCRQNFGDINDMIESFKRVGLIHPPTVVLTESGKYKLAGGGRRLATMNAMGSPYYPVNIREKNDDATIAEMELLENIDRLDMRWDEKVITIEKAHRHHLQQKTKLSQSWGTRETGKLIGKSHVHVAHALKVAPYIRNNDLEIIEAPALLDAYKILLRRAEERADGLRVSQIKKDISNPTRKKSLPVQSKGTINIGDAGSDDMAAVFDNVDVVTIDEDGAISTGADSTFFDGRLDFPLTDWIQCKDSVNIGMPEMEPESVDHIITDPPYGINISEDYLSDASSIKDQHQVKANIAMFDAMLEQFWRVLRPNGFCIVWFDVSHYERLTKFAKKLGFRIQVHPFVWHKTHAVKNNAASTNFTKNFELALVMRKGNAKLKLSGVPALISADGALERRMYSNPFAKPYEVWRSLITAVSSPGDIVFDPFGGNMSCPRACLNLNRQPKAFEIEEHHYNKGLSILTDLVKEMTNGEGTIS